MVVGGEVAARVLVLSGIEDPGGGRLGSWVAWRIVSGNNREMGRSAVVFEDLASCLAGIEELQNADERLEPRMSLDSRRSHWWWSIGLDGQPVAMSSRGYDRGRECGASLAGFLKALPRATVVHPVASGLRRRRDLLPGDFLRWASV